MNFPYKRFIESNRETLKEHGRALLFLDWAECAINQGADPERMVFEVMKYNVDGRETKADKIAMSLVNKSLDKTPEHRLHS